MLTLVVLLLALSACSQASIVSANISKEADAFNIMRRLSVINARTDKPMLEIVGNLSLGNNTNNELTVTVEVGPDQYKKHFVYLNEWTLYVVEDINGADVSPYHYEINFLPEMIQPITFTNSY
jgi:hypothetical protein